MSNYDEYMDDESVYDEFDEEDVTDNGTLDDTSDWLCGGDNDAELQRGPKTMPPYGLPLSGHIKRADLNGLDQTARFVEIMRNYRSNDPALQDKARYDALAELDALIKHVMSTHYNTYRIKYGQDMYDEGVIAVYEALPKYDPSVSRPTVYFYLPIKHAMQQYVATNVHHVSRHYADQMTKLKKAASKMRAETGVSEINPMKLSKVSNIPLSTVLEAYRQNECVNSIPFDVENENSISVTYEPSPVDIVIEKERKDAVESALCLLDPLEVRILCLRTGYGDERVVFNGKVIESTPTEEKIAKYLSKDYPGLTSAQVHNLYTRALQKLKRRPELRDYAGKPDDQKKSQDDKDIATTRVRRKIPKDSDD